MSERLYTIKEMADEFGVTLRTIRFYEERGLISPKREVIGKKGLGIERLFSEADRFRLRNLRRVLAMGFTIEEARQIITADGSIDLSLERIAEQEKFLLDQAEELKLQLAALHARAQDLAA